MESFLPDHSVSSVHRTLPPDKSTVGGADLDHAIVDVGCLHETSSRELTSLGAVTHGHVLGIEETLVSSVRIELRSKVEAVSTTSRIDEVVRDIATRIDRHRHGALRAAGQLAGRWIGLASCIDTCWNDHRPGLAERLSYRRVRNYHRLHGYAVLGHAGLVVRRGRDLTPQILGLVGRNDTTILGRRPTIASAEGVSCKSDQNPKSEVSNALFRNFHRRSLQTY